MPHFQSRGAQRERTDRMSVAAVRSSVARPLATVGGHNSSNQRVLGSVMLFGGVAHRLIESKYAAMDLAHV